MADCSQCPLKDKCSTEKKQTCVVENNPYNNVKNIIGVMSGKGGVGKSTVAVMLANELVEKGFKVGILDADVTGPSVPRLLKIQDKRATVLEQGILPVLADNGLKVMSLNLLIEDENTPVIWRGPILSGTVKQFWTDVLWENLDYLVIDLPPGTGDVSLTVMQVMPITGMVMVSVPQDMVSMIVSKSVTMVHKMNIEVLGVVENMSYMVCPNCGTKIKLFEDDTKNFLDSLNIKLLGELPMCKDILNISRSGISAVTEPIKKEFSSITDKVLSSIK